MSTVRQQSVGLIQRVLDEAGLCTISIRQVVEITALIKPSRALFVAHPFGLAFDPVGAGPRSARSWRHGCQLQ